MYFTIGQLTPYQGEVGTRADVREKALPSTSLKPRGSYIAHVVAQECYYLAVPLYSS